MERQGGQELLSGRREKPMETNTQEYVAFLLRMWKEKLNGAVAVLIVKLTERQPGGG